MKPATSGEKLYFLIRDVVLIANDASGLDWPTVNEFLAEVAGTERFAFYVRGAIAIHAMRRLLRYWAEEKQQLNDESQYIKKAKKIIGSEVFPWLSDDLKGRLARHLIAASDSSFRSISPTVRKNVIGLRGTANCYLCDKQIFDDRSDQDPDLLTLEHLWPQSMGGDSIEANLVPACPACQNDTKDTLSWEWLNIHNLVLPPEPTEQALKSISRKTRVAKHFEHAIKIATEEKITLKNALLRIGPRQQELSYVKTGMPVTFFDLKTVTDF
ncbi:hypothetical protein [Duganella fentianensis]|uniref:HNH endonuclease n=1 Tax=Duganella fentianensis TaxID=2692177 RepID=UPI0032B100C7